MFLKKLKTKIIHFINYHFILPQIQINIVLFRYIVLSVSFLCVSCSANVNYKLIGDEFKNNSKQCWTKHRQEILKIKYFEAHGTIYCASGINKTYVKFIWIKNNSNTNKMLLTTPVLFGKKIYLNITNDVIEIDPQHKIAYQNEITTLIQKKINTIVPISRFFYWIIGVTKDNNEQIEINNCLIKTINYFSLEKQWNVLYVKYNTDTQFSLPSYLVIKTNNTQVKIIINRWIAK